MVNFVDFLVKNTIVKQPVGEIKQKVLASELENALPDEFEWLRELLKGEFHSKRKEEVVNRREGWNDDAIIQKAELQRKSEEFRPLLRVLLPWPWALIALELLKEWSFEFVNKAKENVAQKVSQRASERGKKSMKESGVISPFRSHQSGPIRPDDARQEHEIKGKKDQGEHSNVLGGSIVHF